MRISKFLINLLLGDGDIGLKLHRLMLYSCSISETIKLL